MIRSFGANGAKNAIVTVSGITAAFDFEPIVTFDELKTQKLKIEQVTFSFQEKLGFFLWWIGPKTLILPIESRGFLNFEGTQCLHSPEGATGIAVSSYGGEGAFLLSLDMAKQ